MKITYFLDFPFSVGGANKVLLLQAYIMKSRGHDVMVVIPNDKDQKHALEYDVLCREYGMCAVTAQYSISTCTEGIDILSSIEQYDKIYDLIKKEGPDLVCSAQINVAVEMAARELKIPHLMNIYQTDQDSFRIKWLDVYPHYHSADSELFSEMWGKGLHIHSKCIRVAYENRKQVIRREKENKDLIHILSIGAFYERKNQLEIIKFILKCKNDGMQVRLVFLGNDSSVYGDICKQFVRENELEEYVKFKGFVHNVEDYFCNADLMILASKVESYPGVIVESIANHVPVLTTPVAGVPELMKDGYNCLALQGYESDDIYAAFKRYMVFRNENKIQDIIRNADTTFKENHTCDIVGNKLEDYYTWILQDYKSRYICKEEIKKLFNEFLENKILNGADSYTKCNIWFLYHIDQIVKQKKPQKVIIWGAGYFGKIVLEWLTIINCIKQFAGFIDVKKKGEYLTYPILDQEEIENCDLLFVAVSDLNSRLDIMKYLEEHGMKRNETYFMAINSPIRI